MQALLHTLGLGLVEEGQGIHVRFFEIARQQEVPQVGLDMLVLLHVLEDLYILDILYSAVEVFDGIDFRVEALPPVLEHHIYNNRCDSQTP